MPQHLRICDPYEGEMKKFRNEKKEDILLSIGWRLTIYGLIH